MSGKLYLVGTPIGNLGDISPRVARTLEETDFIAAEDTRVTLKILNHLGIKKPLVSYYEHNRAESGEKIISRILGGETCVLVSDAGMPAISDPGQDLVRLCAENGIEVVAVPGPCAAVCAIALSGLETGRFTFEGFLSTARKSRFEHLEELKTEKRTMIFYEAPHKLRATLSDMVQYFGGDRKIAICREMTKLHEEVLRFTLRQAVEYYEAVPPKGEFVLVIEGLKEEEKISISPEQGAEMVLEMYSSGTPLKSAAKEVAAKTGLKRNELYDLALKMKD